MKEIATKALAIEFIEEKTLNKKRNRDDNDTETNNK